MILHHSLKTDLLIPFFTGNNSGLFRRSCLILFLFVNSYSPQPLIGQAYVPLVKENIHYGYEKRYGDDLECSVYWVEKAFVLSIMEDTVVENETYHKVFYNDLAILPQMGGIKIPYTITNSALFGLIREDTTERKVYLNPNAGHPGFYFCDTVEHVLFDFSLKARDTLNECVVEQIGFFNTPIVDSITIVNAHGKNRRAFHTFGVFGYCGLASASEGSILEGFGYQYHGLYNDLTTKALFFYCEGSFDDCNIISSRKEWPVQVNGLAIFPNPVGDQLHIELPSDPNKGSYETLVIMDISGRMIFSEAIRVRSKNRYTLNVSNYTPGIYIAAIISKHTILRTKFIKQ